MRNRVQILMADIVNNTLIDAPLDTGLFTIGLIYSKTIPGTPYDETWNINVLLELERVKMPAGMRAGRQLIGQPAGDAEFICRSLNGQPWAWDIDGSIGTVAPGGLSATDGTNSGSTDVLIGLNIYGFSCCLGKGLGSNWREDVRCNTFDPRVYVGPANGALFGVTFDLACDGFDLTPAGIYPGRNVQFGHAIGGASGINPFVPPTYSGAPSTFSGVPDTSGATISVA